MANDVKMSIKQEMSSVEFRAGENDPHKKGKGDGADYLKSFVPDKKSFALFQVLDVDLLASMRKEDHALENLAERCDKSGFSFGGDSEMLRQKQKDAMHLLYTVRHNEMRVRDLRKLDAEHNVIATLKELSEKYAKSLDKVHELFVQLSGNLENVEKKLKGEDVVTWNSLEDFALMHPEDAKMYDYLIRTKGEQQMQARKVFLDFFKNTKDTSNIE